MNIIKQKKLTSKIGFNHIKTHNRSQVKSEKVSRYKAFISSKNEYLNCQKKSPDFFKLGLNFVYKAKEP
jgi:hypothetical protein